jgi:hypothetical protein
MRGNGICSAGGFGLIIGGRDVERYSEDEIRDACIVQWQAEAQASLYWPQRGQSKAPWVPAQWTAWLLMEKAGVPRELIAYVCHVDPRRLRKCLLVATALMLLPPYAARIEKLKQPIPRYRAPHVPTLRPAKEAACAVQAG